MEILIRPLLFLGSIQSSFLLYEVPPRTRLWQLRMCNTTLMIPKSSHSRSRGKNLSTEAMKSDSD